VNDSTTLLQGWIARMHAGDEAAKDQLLNHAYGRLRRLARKMLQQDFPRLKESEETDDVLQNVALRLNRALQTTHVATVVDFFRLSAAAIRQELIDLARHHRQVRGRLPRNAPARTDPDSAPSSAADPSDSTCEPGRLQAWTEFHQQVDALPDAEREVFDLIWYQELTQSEAASLLQVPRPTVQRLWLKARLRLKAILDRRQWGFLTATTS
jgi:RNA polymerase sigma-70 factor (ECF subfamily)